MRLVCTADQNKQTTKANTVILYVVHHAIVLNLKDVNFI